MKRKEEPDCIFCKIVSGKIPCHKIYEDRHTLAFLDIVKDYEGHTLVIPKKHTENIFTCPPSTLKHVSNTVKKVSEHYKKVGYSGINIFNASGESAGQSVFHLHFHVIPRTDKETQLVWASKKSNPAMNLEEFQRKLNMLPQKKNP